MARRRIQCFWLEPIASVRVSLRRYRGGSLDDCPVHGYHTTSAVIVEAEPKPLPEPVPRGYEHSPPQDLVPHDDPRWPTRCECGYEYVDDDCWQINRDRLYERSDGGPRCTMRDVPPGAMWDAWWRFTHPPGPDGRQLTVQTPDGPWCVDSPSSNGKTPWTRTGKPPLVTARPSILMPGGYHAFLTEGVLEEC